MGIPLSTSSPTGKCGQFKYDKNSVCYSHIKHKLDSSLKLSKLPNYPYYFYNLLDYPQHYYSLLNYPNVIKATTITPATDRELCFRSPQQAIICYL